MLLLPGYELQKGSGIERSLLVKFMDLTYQELFPQQQDFSHLAATVEGYFSQQTPLWWVQSSGEQLAAVKVGCLWLGNAVDQVRGDRHAHVFLLYILPEHRRRGLGSALMRHAEEWAKARGDRQIGLQVFQSNQPALNLYQHLGYETQSLWMSKPLS
jgi:ribosomal protein S18 acetylase RimI-like enzyme